MPVDLLGKEELTGHMHMTEEEFDILDELYFLQPYSYLQETLDFSPEKLKAILQELVGKGWVRVYRNATDEIDTRELGIAQSAEEYLYLASKEGLLIHNGR